MAAKIVCSLLLAFCLVQSIQGNALDEFKNLNDATMKKAQDKMEEMQNSLQNKANDVMDQMNKKADDIPNQVAKKVEEIGKKENPNGVDIKECVNQAQSDASAAVEETKTAMKDCVEKVKKDIKDYIDQVKGTIDDTKNWAQGLISNTTQCLKEHFFVMCAKQLAGVAKAIPIMLDFGKDYVSGAAVARDIPLELGKCGYNIAEKITAGVDNVVSKAATCIKDKATAAMQKQN